MSKPLISKIIIILIIIVILSIAAASLLISYLNNTFIPVRLKGFVVEKLTEYTKHIVTIDSLKFSLKNGFMLKDIKIYKDSKGENTALFKADSATFRVFIIPSLKKQRVIIPSVNLSGAFLDLERYPDGDWNISSFFKNAASNKHSRISVVLKELSFNNSRLLIRDSYPKKPISKELTSFSGTVGLSLPDKIRIRCNGRIDESNVSISGVYEIRQNKLSTELKVDNLEINNYADTYLPANVGLIRTGLATSSIKIKISSFKTIQANGTIVISGLNASINNTDISGNCELSGSATLDIENPSKIKYALEVKADNTEISNKVKLLNNISKIQGIMILTEKTWVIKNLSCLCYGSALNISGEIETPHEDFTVKANLLSEVSLKDISEDINVAIESGNAKINANLIYKKDGTYKINGTSDIKRLRLLQKNILLSGDFLINGESTGRIDDWQSLNYKGIIDFNNMEVKSEDLLPFLSDATGQASFTTKSISIEKLTGVAAETKISLNGGLDYSKDSPEMLLRLKTGKLAVSKLISTLPDNIKARFKKIDIEGQCYLNVNFKGALGKPETYSYAGSALLNNGLLNLKYWPYTISGIDCEVDFKDQQVSWEDLAFNIKNKRYTSHGKLTNLTQPLVSANIKSDILNVACVIETDKNNALSISKLEGQYRNSSFSFNGMINNLQSAYADIKGDIYLSLADTQHIFTSKKEMLQNLKPKGTIKLAIDMKGPLKKPAEWTLFTEGSSKSISLAGLTLRDFYMDYRMKDNFIDIPVISVFAYGGIININSRANIKAEERPFIINMDIKDIDLHELIKDTKNKDKKIKGALSSKIVMNGYLNEKDSLKGSGWLQVSDGYLWEFPVLHGIMDIILMVPPENIVLTDAFGNFTIANNRVYTEDFKLLSKVASLLWVGSIGFDSTLDFNITGRFAENVIKQTTEPGRIASAILHEAGSLIMEVRLTGTLKEPIYQIVPFPLKRIFKEKVVDALNDIFGNIGE